MNYCRIECDFLIKIKEKTYGHAKFFISISQLAEEKGLQQEKVFETVEHALALHTKRNMVKKDK
jgi:hypothetical protein